MDNALFANLLTLASLLLRVAVYYIQWRRGKSGGASS